MTLFRITGLFLIALPVAFNLVFFALSRAFEYPAILRQPTDTILRKFVAGGKRLIGLWYAFAMTALLAVPAALLLAAVFADQPQIALASAILGVVSGLVQVIGLLRWSLLVPSLASQYFAPTATAAQKDAISTVFHAFHQFMGVVVGEHLGYLFTASWTILLSVMMIASPVFSPLVGVFGIIAAVGILAGLLEPAGWKPAGMINAMSYIVWSLWLVAAGLTLVLA